MLLGAIRKGDFVMLGNFHIRCCVPDSRDLGILTETMIK